MLIESHIMTFFSSFKKNHIPLSVDLNSTLEQNDMGQKIPRDKKRIIHISSLAILLGVVVSIIAKSLVVLIDLIIHLSFHGRLAIENASPIGNHLGLWVIAVPTIGGLIVGLMAYYGSAAIRGHGIPEAMEQILTNQSKIKPKLIFLKPISSAIAMGTGGPFGAEGPIIATGGALGSTLGQLLKITPNERKILLAAGATAGMSAIFGTPIAAIFLAIELLLFEFSPRSIIPVALACITGAAGHHFFFSSLPVFPMAEEVLMPSNIALAVYSLIGIIIGFVSIFITKFTYWVEDLFHKIPLHWMWYPAIGGVFVGLIGYFDPRTMSMGYENITDILSNSLSFQAVAFLCILKFLSWVIALGSGTSGGTLAPLFTIGGALGIVLGTFFLYLFPDSGITLPLAALISMAALFAGSSRALLTSIVFALEVTAQSNALLPLLAACAAAYFISFFLMENTIMTEKIARRGVKTPDSYESDNLESMHVSEVMNTDTIALDESNTIEEIRNWLNQELHHFHNYFIVIDKDHGYKGLLKTKLLFRKEWDLKTPIHDLIQYKDAVTFENQSLRSAVALMSKEDVDILPVLSLRDSHTLMGVLSYQNVLAAYHQDQQMDEMSAPVISLRRRGLRILVHGQKLWKSS